MNCNLRWKIITIVVVFIVFAPSACTRSPPRITASTSPGWLMDKQLKLGLDLKGGVHLVLRVQTDDALRVETEQEMERLREELQTRNINVTNIDAARRRRSSASRACRRRRTPRSVRPPPKCRRTSTAAPASNGTYTFTMKPNVQLNLRDDAVVQARQTIERRVNELGVTEPSIAQQGRTAIRFSSSCRASPTSSARRNHPVDRPPRAEDRRAGAGADARKR